MIRGLFIIAFSLLLHSTLVAQTKHALLIAISDYPQITGRGNWTPLSSRNDHELVKEMLKRQQFDNNNIISLLDKEATVINIENSFEKLIAECNSGDIVYFHFSGHGQQIPDVNPEKNYKSHHLRKDERDGLDEALVTFNAPKEFAQDYQYQDHFVDDQMSYYMNRLRKKIGGTGQVIAVFDCCHSGSVTRGAQAAVVRGSNIICAPADYKPEGDLGKDSSLAFDADFDYVNNNEMGKLTSFFGCKSNQQVEEIFDLNTYKNYGSLTYYFVQAIEELGPSATYNNLFTKINEKMVVKFKNKQQPEVESDNLNQLIFKGAFVDQKPYFLIIKKISTNIISINGGSLQGLSVGDSIALFNNTTINTKGQASVNVGVVSEVRPYSALLQLNKPFDNRENAEVYYRAFLTYTAAPPIQTKICISVKSKSLRKELEKLFEKEKAIELAETGYDYQIADTMFNANSEYVIVYLGSGRKHVMRNMSPLKIKGDEAASLMLLQYIKQSMKTDLFRKVNVDDQSLTFEYEILPCSASGDCKTDSTLNMSGNLRFKDGSLFKIKVRNTGKSPIFLNVVDIDPNNRLVWFQQDENGTLLSNKLINSNQTQVYDVSIVPPYGIEQMKLIATNAEVNFSTLEENGSSLSRGGNVNPLIDFIDQSVNGSRSANVKASTGATVKTLTFEIMER